MASIFQGPLIISGSTVNDYVGFGINAAATASTGPRIVPVAVDPNGVVTAPQGSIALRTVGGGAGTTVYSNRTGAAVWDALA